MFRIIRGVLSNVRQPTPTEAIKNTPQAAPSSLATGIPTVKDLVNVIATERDRRNEQFTKQLFDKSTETIERLTRELSNRQADEVIFFIDLADSKVTALALNLAIQREMAARNIEGLVVIRQHEGKTKLNFWRNPPPPIDNQSTR